MPSCVDPQASLATLLLSLGLLPVACDRSGPVETSDEGEPSARPERKRRRAQPPTTKKERDGGRFPCKQSFPLKIGGQATGFELCAAGYHHRTEAKTCPSELPRDRTCVGGGDENLCTRDEECKEKANGFCRGPSEHGASWAPSRARAAPPSLRLGCACDYGCASDADCSEGMICLCDAPAGRCVRSSCRSDADCDEGLLCAEVASPYDFVSFACQKAKDACMTDADCKSGERCELRGDVRICDNRPMAVPGRPFLVAGHARTATEVSRGDWSHGPQPSLAGLSPSVRERLAAHWTRAALMEHASIAAFARFVLQLLEMGAPADLVTAAHAAMADETRHAEVCFAMASAYAGRAIGPGPLAMHGAMTAMTRAEVFCLVVREGCVGETLAALEAEEASQLAEDPVVARVYAEIAADELTHAVLAWRYVAWAIGEQPALGALLLEELEAAETGDVPASEHLPAHGVLGAAHLGAVRRCAFRHVVAPAARALLGGSPRSDRERPRAEPTVSG